MASSSGSTILHPQHGASRPPSLRYMGFRCTDEGRAYALRVDLAGVVRNVTVTIPHQAFDTRLARFQDAPDMCFTRLQRELEQNPELPDGLELVLTREEMQHYRDVQGRPAARRTRKRPVEP